MSKTVLITGASKGFGKETAKWFANNGWNVAATMRSPEKETELQNLPNTKVYQLDVTKDSSDAVSQIIQDFGQIDVVVNNAGYGAAGPMEQSSIEQIHKQFDVNVYGVARVMQSVLPHFRERKQGQFINISSVLGFLTMPNFSVYNASKHALEGLTETMRYELEPFGIKLNLIQPGGYATNFFESMTQGDRGINVPEYKEMEQKLGTYFQSSLESGGFGHPSEVAEAIWNAANEQNWPFRYVVGEGGQQMAEMRKNVDIETYIQNVSSTMLG